VSRGRPRVVRTDFRREGLVVGSLGVPRSPRSSRNPSGEELRGSDSLLLGPRPCHGPRLTRDALVDHYASSCGQQGGTGEVARSRNRPKTLAPRAKLEPATNRSRDCCPRAGERSPESSRSRGTTASHCFVSQFPVQGNLDHPAGHALQELCR
jgi:hypothetical protein